MKDGEVVQVGTGEEILTNPANDYVKRFVKDVDRSKIITAENIMQRSANLNISHDGPRVAKQRMEDENLSNMLVIDKERKLQGYVTDDDVVKAIRDGLKLEDILRKDIPTVSKDKLMNELYDIISDIQTPIAVTDDNNKLLGIIIRKYILDALAQQNAVVEEDEAQEDDNQAEVEDNG